MNPSADVFAAPAILEELGHELKEETASGRIEKLSDDPAFMVELQRQPLSPGDMTALLSTLGTGDIEVELQGFAHSRFTRTRVKNLWRSRIINNSGKTLLDAFVIARVPPEVPVSAEEFPEAVRKCTDLIEWIRPEENILPGTPYRDLPDEFVCPDCGHPKSAFIPADEDH